MAKNSFRYLFKCIQSLLCACVGRFASIIDLLQLVNFDKMDSSFYRTNYLLLVTFLGIFSHC